MKLSMHSISKSEPHSFMHYVYTGRLKILVRTAGITEVFGEGICKSLDFGNTFVLPHKCNFPVKPHVC